MNYGLAMMFLCIGAALGWLARKGEVKDLRDRISDLQATLRERLQR